MPTAKKKVGLALGSGGLRGLAHIGVLKVLTSEKIPIDFLAGSSAGAIVAAYFAVHGEIESFEKLVLRMTKVEFARLIDLGLPKKALIRGRKIKRFLNELFEKKSFSRLKIPLTIVATDLRTGREIQLKRGNVAEAVMASAALPGAFPPIAFKKYLLVDGGVVNPTPINALRKMRANILIGVDLTMAGKAPLRNPNVFEILLRSFDVLRTQTIKAKLSKNKKNLVIIKPHIKGSFNFLAQLSKRKALIKKGEKATKIALPKIKKLLTP